MINPMTISSSGPGEEEAFADSNAGDNSGPLVTTVPPPEAQDEEEEELVLLQLL